MSFPLPLSRSLFSGLSLQLFLTFVLVGVGGIVVFFVRGAIHLDIGRVVFGFGGEAGVVFIFGEQEFEVVGVGVGRGCGCGEEGGFVCEEGFHAVAGCGALGAGGGEPFCLLLLGGWFLDGGGVDVGVGVGV